MDRESNAHIFRLGSVTRIHDGVSCVITMHGAHSENRDSQRILYHERENSIGYEQPEAPFSPWLKKNEGLLKKIISIALKNASPSEIDIPFVFQEKLEARKLPENAIQVFTDGSLSSAGVGGWAGVIIYSTGDIVEKSGYEPCCTSNRAELLAVAQTLDSISSDGPAIVYTDSRYVIRGVETWLANWELNGFFTAQNRPVKNRDLWETISGIKKKREVYFKWVPSSGDDPLHRRCDSLAREMTLPGK